MVTAKFKLEIHSFGRQNQSREKIQAVESNALFDKKYIKKIERLRTWYDQKGHYRKIVYSLLFFCANKFNQIVKSIQKFMFKFSMLK